MRIEVQNLPTPEKNANRHQSDTRPKKMLKTINQLVDKNKFSDKEIEFLA